MSRHKVRKFATALSILAICFCSNVPQPLFACMDVAILSKEKTILATSRSMEFTYEMHSSVVKMPKNSASLIQRKEDTKWDNKYGYLFINGLHIDYAIADGMNEKGLSFAALWYPDAQYVSPNEVKGRKAVSNVRFGHWVLGNFDNINDLKTALKDIAIVNESVEGKVFTLHYVIHDADGKSIVIEYDKGKMNVYDNVTNIVTNAPSYPWHVSNVDNYRYLIDRRQDNTSAKMLGGLPGDYSPASRFIRGVALSHFIQEPETQRDAIISAYHIINSVDIPHGAVLAYMGADTPQVDYTQWTLLRDHINLSLFFKTYSELSMKEIKFADLDFTNGKIDHVKLHKYNNSDD